MSSSSPLKQYALATLVATIALLSYSLTAWARDPITSPQYAVALKEAQNAVMQKRWADVISHANSVLAGTSPKSDDAYAANYFLMTANRGLRNAIEMRKALLGMLATDVPSPEQRAAFQRTIDQIDAKQ